MNVAERLDHRRFHIRMFALQLHQQPLDALALQAGGPRRPGSSTP